jgi:putative endonuclease
MKAKQKGYEGEERAARYLEEQGIKIIKRNFKGLYGEVDIIGEECQCLIFVEVKNWSFYCYDDLEYAINRRKKANIIVTALEFIGKYPQYADYGMRFDVVFLSGKTGELRYIKHAFEGDGAPL